MNHVSDKILLSNGYAIPCVGFGTYQIPDGEPVAAAVEAALKAGYRHIDTAACYKNERGVGEGIRRSGISREEIFVTSKVWNTERGYEKTLAAFEATMERLGLDYLDLYLIHRPATEKRFADWREQNLGSWRAMIELYRAGRIRAIGVSNFLPHHLKDLLETEIVPMVNQIEFHPGFRQEKVVDFCRKNGIEIEAWSPLGTGELLENETLREIASRYGVSVAQLCLGWCMRHGTIPLPKSATPARIAENAQIFGFDISDEDMATIDALGFIGGSGLDPDEIDF